MDWSKLSVVAAHAIPRKLYAIEDTRHAHAARRPNIRSSHRQNLKSCNKNFFYGLPSKLLQLFYFIVESRKDIPYGPRNLQTFAHFYVLSAHYIALLRAI
jgi:hypothetical protein